MTMEDLCTFFTAQNSYVQAKKFLRKLSAAWVRTLKKIAKLLLGPKV